jgi:hypothetical protein
MEGENAIRRWAKNNSIKRFYYKGGLIMAYGQKASRKYRGGRLQCAKYVATKKTRQYKKGISNGSNYKKIFDIPWTVD